jgi:NADPH-dependent ferric siderophore reductase
MPEMPAFIADVVEPTFARRARVERIDDLGPRLRCVRFSGVELRGLAFRPGQEVEFRVSDRAFRHYTPTSFDPARGAFDVYFHLHGDGQGADWARRLRQDDFVRVLGPGGRFGLRPASTTHVFLGDETTAGLFACLAASASGNCLGAIEVGPGTSEADWLRVVPRPLAIVRRSSARGFRLVDWLEEVSLRPGEDVSFYLAGHLASILCIRAVLIRNGWPRRSIRTKAYWADGKRGL